LSGHEQLTAEAASVERRTDFSVCKIRSIAHATQMGQHYGAQIFMDQIAQHASSSPV
jgi:hypothetical protein